MERYLPAVILVLGVLLAARITRWVNRFTFGENREKAERLKKETEKRE